MTDENSKAWLQAFVEVRGEQKRFADLSEEDCAWLGELYKKMGEFKRQGMDDKAALAAARKTLAQQENA